jgi:hypothetical protein
MIAALEAASPMPGATFEPEPASSPPVVGSAEWVAARTAQQLIDQSNALDAVRQREQPRVEEYDSAADEKRRRWLSRALMNSPAQRFGEAPGGTVEVLPNGVPTMVTKDADGLVQKLSPLVIAIEDISPGQWDEYDRVWQRRQREAENTALAREFSADLCVEEGVMSQEEAAALDPVASRYVKPMRGLEGL